MWVPGLYTGVRDDKMRNDFKIPFNLNISAVLGFGLSKRTITGERKNRKPLNELAYSEIFGNSDNITQ